MKPCCTRPLSLPVHPVRAYRRFLLFGTTILILLGLCGVESPTHAASSSIQKIVAGGDPTPLGGVFASDGTPAIGLGISSLHEAKAVTFFANVEEGNARRGIFVADGGTLTKVVAEGDPTPLGGTYLIVSPPAQNGAGDVAFSAVIEDGSASQGIFLFSKGHLTVIAAFGADSALKKFTSSPFVPTLNNQGEVAFRAVLPIDEREMTGIFLSSAGAADQLVLDLAPTPTGAQISISPTDTFPLPFNDAGETIVSSTGEDDTDGPALFLASRAGNLTQIVAVGDAAPGGGTFSSFTQATLNNRGVVVFGAGVADGAISQGIFLASQGQFSRVVAEGDRAPHGGRFSFLPIAAPPLVNDWGEVAFSALVKEEGNESPTSGLFLASNGTRTKIMRAGDPSPLGGTLLGGPVSFQLSNTGTVRFLNVVDTDGDGFPNTQGIFSVQP